MVEWKDLGLDSALCTAVSNAFESIKEPTEIQQNVMKAFANGEEMGRDILLRSKTGSGKTLAFLLPIINKLLLDKRASAGQKSNDVRNSLGTKMLIIVPTRELATQTQTVLQKLLGKLNGHDHWLVSSSLSGGDRRKSEKERLRKGVHIVVGTPGRLLDHLKNTECWKKRLSCEWIVMDEADRLLDSGFEKFMKEILDITRNANSPLTKIKMLLCSATVQADLKNIFGYPLCDPLFITSTTIKKSVKSKEQKKEETPSTELLDPNPSSSISTPSQLEHHFVFTPTRFRLSALLGLLSHNLFNNDAANNDSNSGGMQKLMLFSICCDTVDFMYNLLTDSKLNLLKPTSKKREGEVKIYKLHGNMEHKDRQTTFASFIKETGKCLLICTDVAARGLNLSGVSMIIQYDAPCDINDYVHRSGRTARQEERGKSVLFLMPSERDYISMLTEKGLEVKKMKWELFAEEIINRLKLELAAKKEQDDSQIDEEDGASLGKEVPLDLRRKNFALLSSLQTKIKESPTLLPLAKRAYLSFVRAYATHPNKEKVVFHVKKLHLGHLATTFLLDEAPKAVAAYRQTPKSSPSMMDAKQGSKKVFHKSKRQTSEFDAGDLTAMTADSNAAAKSKSRNRSSRPFKKKSKLTFK